MLHALANVTTKIATIVMQKIIASCSAGNMSNCSLLGFPLGTQDVCIELVNGIISVDTPVTIVSSPGTAAGISE